MLTMKKRNNSATGRYIVPRLSRDGGGDSDGHRTNRGADSVHQQHPVDGEPGIFHQKHSVRDYAKAWIGDTTRSRLPTRATT